MNVSVTRKVVFSHVDIRGMQQTFGLILILLSIFGYPYVGALQSLIPSNYSWSVAVAFRAAVDSVALVMFILGIAIGIRKPLGGPVLLFIFAYLLRLLYDFAFNERISVSDNLFFFVFTVFIPTLVMSLTFEPKFDDNNFARILSLIGTPFLLLVIYLMLAGYSYDPWADAGLVTGSGGSGAGLQFYNLNHISLGIALGSVLLSDLSVAFNKTQTRELRLFSLFKLPIAAYLILITGSRGALIATVISSLIILARNPLLVLVIALVALGIEQSVTIDLTNSNILTSINSLASDKLAIDLSLNERFVMQKIAIEEFFASPVVGLNSISIAYGIGEYPHNIVIEVAMAMGIVGLGIFINLYTRIFRWIMMVKQHKNVTLSSLFLLNFILAQSSGAIWGDGTLFVLTAAILRISGSTKELNRASAIQSNDRNLRSSLTRLR